MSGDNSVRGFGPLYAEHLMLGASFANGTKVLRYQSEPLSVPDLSSATYLCDLTHASLVLIGGQDATPLAQSAFAGDKLEVGECQFEPALTGDGGVASIPLLMRTGNTEYVAMDVSPRADVLMAWLSFLSSISQEGYEPFGHAEVQDVTQSHALLLLAGKDATTVLEDYVQGRPLPSEGRVASCALDRIPAIVVRLPHVEQPCYVVMVPPHHAVALWRSFLSFVKVTPVGTSAAWSLLAQHAPWMDWLLSTDALRTSAQELEAHRLLRGERDFVGARALFG